MLQRSAYFSRSSAAAFLRSYILSTNCFAIDGSERHVDSWHKEEYERPLPIMFFSYDCVLRLVQWVSCYKSLRQADQLSERLKVSRLGAADQSRTILALPLLEAASRCKPVLTNLTLTRYHEHDIARHHPPPLRLGTRQHSLWLTCAHIRAYFRLKRIPWRILSPSSP